MRLIYIIQLDLDSNGSLAAVINEKVRSMKRILGTDNVTVWHPKLGKNPILKYTKYVLFDFICALRLLRFKKGRDSKVIYRTIYFPMSHVVMKIKGIKSAYEMHADLKNEIPLLNKSKVEIFLLKVLAKFERMNLRKSEAVIYNHPVLLNKFKTRFLKPSIYTYNGVNPDKFRPLDRNTCRSEIGWSSNIKIGLFLGSISKWHGVNYLIDIYNKINEESSDYHLYIVGATNTEYIRELKNTAKDNQSIKFFDRVPPEDTVKYINASDYCLLPVNDNRTSPGSPLKLYEYVACGKPIITQENKLGYSDEVEKYKLGLALDLTLPETAAVKIMQFMNSDNQEQYLDSNRKSAIEHFNWDDRISKWIELVVNLD